MLGSFSPLAPAALPFSSLQAFSAMPSHHPVWARKREEERWGANNPGRPCGDVDPTWGAGSVRFLLHGAVLNIPHFGGRRKKKKRRCHIRSLKQWINSANRHLLARWYNFLIGQQFQPFLKIQKDWKNIRPSGRQSFATKLKRCLTVCVL